MSEREEGATEIAREEQEARHEMAQVSRALTMTIRASIIALAVGGLTLLFAGRSGAAVGVTCAGVYLLVNLWLLAVEAPSGLRRSRDFFYDDVRGVWHSVIINGAVMIVILGAACAVAYYAMRDEATGSMFWTASGLVMTATAAGLIWYQRYMNRLMAGLDQQLRKVGTLDEP